MDDIEKIMVFRDIISGSDPRVVAKGFVDIIERVVILEIIAEERGINIEEEIEKQYNNKWERIRDERDSYIDFIIGKIVHQLEG